MEVTATDGGGLTSLTPAHIYVSITGQNSHPPVFDQLTYSFTVPEDTVHGTTVGTIRATVQPVNGVKPGTFVLTVYSDYPVFIILKKKLKFVLIC